MALNICFYEDEKYTNFFPLTYFRPVFTLRAGIIPLLKRVERYFPDIELYLCCREQVASAIAGDYKEIPVNIIKKGENDFLLLNGRIRNYGDIVKLVRESRISTIFRNDGETVGVLLKNDDLRNLPTIATIKEYQDYIKTEGDKIPDFDTTATLYKYNWEIMADIEKEITADYNILQQSFTGSQGINIHEGVFWVNQDDIFLGNDVEIFPGVVIDASRGPVYICDNVTIEPHAAIYGPVYIGPNSLVVTGKISSSSIGHTCRVGGEVEHSIFHSYVNKYHAGFIGHSYIGSWVNFGAMTTNSDLKNNYSNVRVIHNGEEIDTHSNKVGSFIGDHTKLGIGTLLTTGINIGVCCNIFGGTLLTDKEVPSFSWGSSGNFVKYEFDKAIETVKTVTQRRNYNLSKVEISLLRIIASDEINSNGIFNI